MKNYILPVLLVATTVIVIVGVIVKNKAVNDKIAEEGKEPPKPVHAIHVVPKENITTEVKKRFADAAYVSVELVERTVIEEENGASTTKYDRYVVSDVNLKDGTDWTEDYYEVLAEEESSEIEAKTISFEDGFGISYKDKTGWELYEELIKKYGFTGDLEDVSYDSDTNKITGQNIYLMNEECEVTKYLLSGEAYDELLDSKVTYQMVEDAKGIMVPDCFNASVTYRFEGWTITKTLYLQVLVNDWGEEAVNEVI